MEIIDLIKNNILQSLSSIGIQSNKEEIIVEISKDSSHGDFASNVAMKLFKISNQTNPRLFAQEICNHLDLSIFEKVEIAGPGFINFYMKKDSLKSILEIIHQNGESFGKQRKNGTKINVEFVSANPTGYLHIGTARGAAFGDSLCRILDAAGYEVTREYYINDAGVQITHLGESIMERYKQLLGLNYKIPEDGYFGEDIIEIAKQIKSEYGDDLLQNDNCLDFFKEKGMKIEFERIISHLTKFRVSFDVFTSEKEIRKGNAIEKEIDFLSKYTYLKDGALYLRTTDFVDDKDRVIVKSNGESTYFMPDICYHVDKMSRHFDLLIDVLGADHHGYINRMKSALMMHGYKENSLEVQLIQMVRFIKNGKEFKASKRSGDAITLIDVCDEVGVDPMRYFFAMRAPTSHLDFDMDLATEQSSSNPVYYAQYAHARLCSILKQGNDFHLDFSGKNLKEKSEMKLLKHLSSFEKIVLDAAKERAPFKITNYIHELAENIHGFYQECRVIDKENLDNTSSRLALCYCAKQVMKNALTLIGVDAPIEM